MTLAAEESLRRFLLHARPRGFHRIRQYGLLASARRKDHLERARRLLSVAPPPAADPINEPEARPLCPCCGGTMVLIAVFERRYLARAPPPAPSSSRPQAPCPGTAHPPPPSEERRSGRRCVRTFNTAGVPVH